MRREINNFISVCYSIIRFGVFKLINGSKFQAYIVERFSPNVVFEINKGARVHLGKRVRVHSGSKIKIRSEGSFF